MERIGGIMSRFDVEGYRKLEQSIKQGQIENARHNKLLDDIRQGRYAINLTQSEVGTLITLLYYLDESILQDEDCRALYFRLIDELEIMLGN
jgi:hypothetical protein